MSHGLQMENECSAGDSADYARTGSFLMTS